VAVAERSVLDEDALRELASGHNREPFDREQ
jgi:hypothetical protein